MYIILCHANTICTCMTIKRCVVMLMRSLVDVWLGIYKDQQVALKSMKNFCDSKAKMQFLAEASVMT